MTTIQEINRAIINGKFTNDELSSIIDAVKFNRSQLTKTVKRGLVLGDNVSFNSNKLGRNVQGTVTKIAIKYVTVRTSAGLWKVPANMLEVV
jgi:small-conductance mechanosensitive channel